MASAQSTTEGPSQIDVGISRIYLPEKASSRAREWAEALAAEAEAKGEVEARDVLVSPRFCILIEAIIQETQQEVVLFVEKVLNEEY